MFRKSEPETSNRKNLLRFFIYILITLIVIFIWVTLIAPEFKKLPDNFYYSADLLSLDNFYDEQSKKFEGEHISKTIFNYEVIAKTSTYLIIRNSIKVTKTSNQPIFSVARIYYIDPYTGKHVAVPGEQQRKGYLFAPHYLAKQPFYYWQVNYNAPALMHYVGQERIEGLKVYHYQANYLADQSNELEYLPWVPESRWIKTNVKLDIWVEPISGWLIKYQDNSLAYYYDKNTGAAIAPWNKFSNRYTQTSIHQKIVEARVLKWKFLAVDFGIPILIYFISLLIFFNKKLKFTYQKIANYSRHKRHIILHGISGVILISLGLFSAYYFIWHGKKPTTFKIGISHWNNNIELLSAVDGFKAGLAEYGFHEGENISFVIKNPNSNIENQINIIQEFVRDKVNIIFTLTTPGTLIAKGITKKIPIVFSDVSYPVEAGIIDPAEVEQLNLVGILNYISPAEQFFPFDVAYPYTKKLGFVRHKGDPDSEIQYKEYKEMLRKREIEVIDIPAIDFDDLRIQLNLQLPHINTLFIACDALMRDGGNKIAAEYSQKFKIPSFSCDKDSIMHGAMLGYFADLYTVGKLAGNKAALILRGAEPEWLYSESPTEGYLMINLLTAKNLGIKIPESQLRQASQIVEKNE